MPIVVTESLVVLVCLVPEACVYSLHTPSTLCKLKLQSRGGEGVPVSSGVIADRRSCVPRGPRLSAGVITDRTALMRHTRLFPEQLIPDRQVMQAPCEGPHDT